MNSSLINFYQQTRQHSVNICAPLNTEDYIPQPAEFVSPMKWQLAHTTWFFEEMILKAFQPNYVEFDKNYGFLFNSYYNTIGKRTIRAERGAITRPSVKQVYSYRKYVDKAITELLSHSIPPEIEELITLGLNHEQQHQELMLTDLKYILAQNPLYPVYNEKANFEEQFNSDLGWLNIAEGVYEVGFEGNQFCFDNEKGRHKTYIQACSISKALVTNKEYMEFMESGGYKNFNYWLDEGWTWVQENEVEAPLYWKQENETWKAFGLNGLKELNPEAVLCHINFYEASAFAAYKGMRLPTEFEWEIAADKLSWGTRWEWTNSAYLPYPNFKIKEGAVGEYNGKFMVNQMVLRGASTATAKNHSRKTYRNFFHPHFQWQFTGIRLAK